VNGGPRNSIARLNPDGTIDPDFQSGLSGVGGSVYSVALQSDGKILIGGLFWSVNGIGRTNIARLNSDGTVDQSFQHGLSGTSWTVLSVAVQSDSKVLIGGAFGVVNG